MIKIKQKYLLGAALAATTALTGCESEEYRQRVAALAHTPYQSGVVVADDVHYRARVFVDTNGDGAADKELVCESPWIDVHHCSWLQTARIGDTIEYKALDYQPRTIRIVDKYARVNGLDVHQLDSLRDAIAFQQRVRAFQNADTIKTK